MSSVISVIWAHTRINRNILQIELKVSYGDTLATITTPDDKQFQSSFHWGGLKNNVSNAKTVTEVTDSLWDLFENRISEPRTIHSVTDVVYLQLYTLTKTYI